MRKFHIPYIPYRSLLLSTTVLNDMYLESPQFSEICYCFMRIIEENGREGGEESRVGYSPLKSLEILSFCKGINIFDQAKSDMIGQFFSCQCRKYKRMDVLLLIATHNFLQIVLCISVHFNTYVRTF